MALPRPRTELARTPGLIRLILRRDRLIITVWLLITIAMPLQAASVVRSTYPTAEDRQDRLAQLDALPMFVVFQGRAFGASFEALVAQQALGVLTLLAAIGAALLVARHTRGEESAGRRELLGSNGVGRHAGLAAALAVVLCAGLVIFVLGSAALIGYGLPAAGALLLAAVGGSAAWLGAGLAALLAQLTERSGVAGIGAFLIIYCLHLGRGLTEITGTGWMVWLIPNGWLEQVRPFTADRWWLLLPVLALTVIMIVAAVALERRRDLGAALTAPRPGPAVAAERLDGPFPLCWRLHRGWLLVWSAGLLALALVMGLGGSRAVADYADQPWVIEWATVIGLDDPADAFLLYVAFVFAFPAAVPALLALQRLQRAELSGLAAAVLSTPVGRTRWASAHLSVALATPVVLQIATGLGLGLGGLITTSDPAEVGRALAFTLRLIPAAWVILGIGFVAYGRWPRVAPAVGWVALTAGVLAELAVKAGLLPEIIYRSLSPFAMVSPYFHPTALTYLGLVAATAALIGLGLLAMRRRDLITD